MGRLTWSEVPLKSSSLPSWYFLTKLSRIISCFTCFEEPVKPKTFFGFKQGNMSYMIFNIVSSEIKPKFRKIISQSNILKYVFAIFSKKLISLFRSAQFISCPRRSESLASRAHSISLRCMWTVKLFLSIDIFNVSVRCGWGYKDTDSTNLWCMAHFIYNVAHYNAYKQQWYQKSITNWAWVVTMGITCPPPSENSQPKTHYFKSQC